MRGWCRLCIHKHGTVALLNQLAGQGSTIPNTLFAYVPWLPELDSQKVCGTPQRFQAHDRWKGKKVVIVSVPGAFTPTCTMSHIPPFISKVQELKSKGVDEVVVISANDPFVLSAWSVSQGAKDNLIFAQDVNAAFSKEFGASLDLTEKGFGIRTARYAMIVNDLKVVYFGKDQGELAQSSAETVLSKL